MRGTVVKSDATGATRIEVVVCPKGTRDVDCTANISAAGRLCTISPNFFSRVRLYCVNARQLSIVLCKAGGVRRALSRAVRGRSERTRAGQCRTGRKGNPATALRAEIAVRTHRKPRPLPADGKQPTAAAGGAHAAAHLTPTLRSLHPAPHGGHDHRDQHAERKREQRRERRPAPRARLLIYRVERRGTRVV